MTASGQVRSVCAALMLVSVAACGGGGKTDAAAAPPGASAPAASAQAPAAKADNLCPLTVEQVAAVTGVPMTLTGGCTFFPANGRDIPHVFYVLQVPMVCSSIKPADLGFTEKVEGLAAREAYVKDALDGSHLLVCPNDKGRAFDVVVGLGNDKPKNRAVAIGLAKQLLAAR